MILGRLACGAFLTLKNWEPGGILLACLARLLFFSFATTATWIHHTILYLPITLGLVAISTKILPCKITLRIHAFANLHLEV